MPTNETGLPASGGLEIDAHSTWLLDVVFDEENRSMITCGMDARVRRWSMPEGDPLCEAAAHDQSVNCLAYNPDRDLLATGSTDKTVRLWRASDATPLLELQDRKRVVAAIDISPNGEWVAAGSYGGRAAVWDLQGDRIAELVTPHKNVSSALFTPDGEHLITAGVGGDILVWSLASGKRTATLSAHETAVISLSLAGGHLASLGYEGKLALWDPDSWELVETFQPPSGTRTIAQNPDGSMLALARESSVEIRSTADWSPVSSLDVPAKTICTLAFSPDGRWLAAGRADGKANLWELE